MMNVATKAGPYPPLDPDRERVQDYAATGREPGYDGHKPEFVERKTLTWENGRRVAEMSPFNINHSRVCYLFSHKRIDRRQFAAAERLAKDWQLSKIEPVASNVMVGGGSSGGDNHPNDTKVDAMRRHGAARDALGVAWPLVELVVEKNMSVELASAQLRFHTKYGHGVLWVALHQLADHYRLPRDDR